MKLLHPLLLACSLLFAATAHAEKVTVAAAADPEPVIAPRPLCVTPSQPRCVASPLCCGKFV